jgi:hypothetical protein
MITFEQYRGTDPMPAILTPNANRTLLVVNALLDALPILRFTSGYRSVDHNRRVNGVRNSKHVSALAADFVPTDGVFSKQLLFEVGDIVRPRSFMFIVHDAGSGLHIHIQAVS